MKIILDLDTGIDDALAILYALSKETKDIELIGITCVFGNTDVSNCVKNTCYILNMFNKNIPVFKGEEHSLDTDFYEQKRGGKIFHGENGMANIDIKGNFNFYENASDFLIEMAKKYKNELVIIATGPLTNIAKAIEKDKNSMKLIKELTIMGGNLTVRGNVSPFAEANFNQDAKAADIVLNSGIKITLVPLDVTLKTTLKREDIQDFQNLNENTKFFYKIIDYYIKAHENILKMNACAIHDPLAILVSLNKSFVKTFDFALKVLQGDEDGRLINDINNPVKNVSVCLDVDEKAVKKDFLQSINKILINY